MTQKLQVGLGAFIIMDRKDTAFMTEEELKALQEQLEAKQKELDAKAEEQKRKGEELEAKDKELDEKSKTIDASKANAGEITASLKEGYEKRLSEQKKIYESKIADYKDTIDQLVSGKEKEAPAPSPIKKLNEIRAKEKEAW